MNKQVDNKIVTDTIKSLTKEERKQVLREIEIIRKSSREAGESK